jgi:hypothetical protein
MISLATRPEPSEYAAGFGKYIQLVPEGDIVATLETQLDGFLQVMADVPESAGLAVHAPYSWTIKQVVGHITDCERVFGHRALWLARRGGAPLASFDENEFMQAAEFNRWPLAELVAEFEHFRRGYLLFFRHLAPDAWTRGGTVCDHPATVRAFAYVMAGHAQHHLEILRRRLGRG